MPTLSTERFEKGMAMSIYTLGFAIDENTDHLLLIEKNKPDWQAGKLNGVGGKKEEGETIEQTMVREFYEEVGIKTELDDWCRFCRLSGVMEDKSFIVYCFSAKLDLSTVKQMEEEKPVLINTFSASYGLKLPSNVIDNLRWLVPMAFAQSPVFAHVQESYVDPEP